jgi:hypothetical protein
MATPLAPVDAVRDGHAGGGGARADACLRLRAQLGLPARARRGVEAATAEHPPPAPGAAPAPLEPRLARRVLLGDARLRPLRGGACARAAGARAGGRGRRDRHPRALRRARQRRRPRRAGASRGRRLARRSRAARDLARGRVRAGRPGLLAPDRALARRVGRRSSARDHLRCERPPRRSSVRRRRRHPLRCGRRLDEGGRVRRRPSRGRTGDHRLLRRRHDRAADGVPARRRADDGGNRHARHQCDPDRRGDDRLRRAPPGRAARCRTRTLVRGRRRGRGRARPAAVYRASFRARLGATRGGSSGCFG